MVGSYRRDRHGEDLPVAAGDMQCPEWVCDDARQHWGKIVAMLMGMGLSSPAYTPALALLVNSLARYIQYEAMIDSEGPTTVTDKGNHIVNPTWAARNKSWDQVLKALREFGLTPAALSGVGRREADKEQAGIAGFINPKLVG